MKYNKHLNKAAIDEVQKEKDLSKEVQKEKLKDVRQTL